MTNLIKLIEFILLVIGVGSTLAWLEEMEIKIRNRK